jgi:hypothetical protein
MVVSGFSETMIQLPTAQVPLAMAMDAEPFVYPLEMATFDPVLSPLYIVTPPFVPSLNVVAAGSEAGRKGGAEGLAPRRATLLLRVRFVFTR